MKSMFAVSNGSYSDYSVICLCKTREAAEAVADKLRRAPGSWHTEAFVEEFPVTDETVQQHVELSMTTTLWDDGTETDTRDRQQPEWPWWEKDRCRWRWVRAPMHKGKGGRLDVAGTDHNRVRKVYSEKRAALKADPALAQKEEWAGAS